MAKEKKVLIITDSLGNGGAERQMTLLARYLPSEWDRMVWSIGDGVFYSELKRANINIIVSKRRWSKDISPIFDLYRTAQNFRPDIIHSWGWMSTLSGILISEFLNVPLVNGIIRSGKPYYYRGPISKLLSNWGNVVVSNSEVGLRNWRVKPERGVVIHNGFDWSRLTGRCQDKNSPKRSDGFFRIVMAARMVKAKDFLLFISAARKITENGIRNWKFLAIGEGEDKVSLIENNTDLIQSGVLEFPKASSEVLPFLQESNVGVLLTKSIFHEEGCSNTIMEYMACGLPVVASDNGGNRELIDDTKTGFIIPESNIDELISKLFWLFNNQDQANEMGQMGRKRLEEQFSIKKMVESTVCLYDLLLEKK